MRRQLLAALALLMPLPAVAVAERVGAFLLPDSYENVIVLDGEIDIDTPLEFRRALAERPSASLVVLNSPGGLVASALLIADDLHRAGLSTIVPEGLGCYSACAFIFLAGTERLVEGEFGVHQVWSDVPDIEGLQVSISDIIEMLERFDTPTTVVTRMFRTPSDQMYVFTRAETDALGINRLGAVVLGDAGYMRSLAGELQSQPALRTQAGSAVQSPDYASNWRLALYGGMDFYGQDINMSRQVDSVACAIACMDEPICVAFTFNANPRISTGPNCFLKEGTSRLEIYRDALSGLFIPPDVREPPIFQVDGEVFSPLEVIDLGD